MIEALFTALLLVCPALVITGGVHDLVTYRIPNWISLVLIAAFLPAAGAAFALGVAPGVLGLHLAVGAVALVIGFALFASAGSAAATPSSSRPRRCGSAGRPREPTLRRRRSPAARSPS